jgi:mRNA interferase RelE/StbE
MYKLTYHHKVPEDLKKLSKTNKLVIKKSIEGKLVHDPIFFGDPLRFSLKGLRKLRVGNYRVVFQLLEKEVFIVLIEHRSKVYKSASKRID